MDAGLWEHVEDPCTPVLTLKSALGRAKFSVMYLCAKD
jgi:hypothetical protein